MRFSRFFLVIVALALFASFASPLLKAVEIYPEDKAFWTAYRKAKDLGDDQEIIRLVRRNKKNAVGVIESLTLAICQKESPQDLEDFKAIAEALASTGGEKRYVKRLEFLKTLTPEQRNQRILAYNNYYYGNVKYKEGKAQDNVYTLSEAKDDYAKAVKTLDAIGDNELLAEVATRLAQCLKTMGDDYEACKTLKIALDAMDKLGFPHPDRKWCKYEYDKYIAKGYDPTKPRDQGGAPPEEKKTGGEGGEGDQGGGGSQRGGGAEANPVFSFKEEGETQTWPLKYQAMKKPSEFLTPGFYPGDQPFLWDKAHLQGNGPMQLKPVTCPINIYDKQVNVKRDRFKLTFDIDGNAKTRRVISLREMPQPLSFTTVETGSDGKPLKYQLFVCHPGSQEVIFSLNTNLAPTKDWMVLRSRVGCFMKGKVLGESFVLIDDNTSGVYGDTFSWPKDGLTNGEYPYFTFDAVMVGRMKKAVPFSQIMPIGDAFYKVDVQRFGTQVQTRKVSLDTGTVRLEWKGRTAPRYVIIHGLDRAGALSFFDIADSGRNGTPIPVGKYELACGKIVSGKKNKLQQIRIYRGEMKPFYVRKGKETVVALGSPFKYTWDAMPFGTKFIVKGATINVFGRSGELYTLFWDDVPEVLVSIRIKGTKKLVVKKKPMKKPDINDWYKDQTCIWHPMDFTYDNKRGDDLEVRLETKKHKVLGGPIVGDWK